MENFICKSEDFHIEVHVIHAVDCPTCHGIIGISFIANFRLVGNSHLFTWKDSHYLNGWGGTWI